MDLPEARLYQITSLPKYASTGKCLLSFIPVLSPRDRWSGGPRRASTLLGGAIISRTRPLPSKKGLQFLKIGGKITSYFKNALKKDMRCAFEQQRGPATG